MHPYINEPWYDECIDTAKQTYPDFQHLWDNTLLVDDEDNKSDLDYILELCNNVPIKLRIPNMGKFHFQLVRITFVNDSRFWVVQWIPVNEITALKCLVWNLIFAHTDRISIQRQKMDAHRDGL